MQHITVFGRNYYIIDGVMPDFAQHKMNFLIGKWGNNLDLVAPAWARYLANFLLRKYGST